MVAIYCLRRKQIFSMQQERYQRLVASKKKPTTSEESSSISLQNTRSAKPESPITPMQMNLLYENTTNSATVSATV